MPIKFDNRTFSKFRKAVRYVMKTKGWDEERASAYVASIEKKQGVRYKK